jgi:hypothetical protein
VSREFPEYYSTISAKLLQTAALAVCGSLSQPTWLSQSQAIKLACLSVIPGCTWLVQGFSVLVIGSPGTLALGLAQAVLPVALVDLMAWGMVAWIMLHVLTHWAAAIVLGMGWVGLVLPSAILLVSTCHDRQCSGHQHWFRVNASNKPGDCVNTDG